jgi:glycosyltransferase involved in cell wall biosynthesis
LLSERAPRQSLVKRLCVITTAELIVNFFLRDHLRALSKRYELTLVVDTDDPDFLRRQGIDVRVEPLAIKRKIAPFSDGIALLRLWRLLRKGRFGGVVSVAPKAGLLTAIAARAAGVPFRCHIFQGEVWATRRGVMRHLLKSIDKLVASLSSHLLVISASERDFLQREGVVRAERLQLIAKGSINGVDLQRFRPDAQWREQIRGQLDIPQTATLLLFLGRFTREKGVLELAAAFRRIVERRDDVYLAYVGPDEDGMQEPLRRMAQPYASRIRFVPLSATPEYYLAAADVLALPSHREGFGNVIIEAAAAGVPAVASDIYGISDALIPGVTGVLHPVANVEAIAMGLSRLIEDVDLRRQMGARARERAQLDFSSAAVTAFIVAYIDAGLGSRAG